MKSDVKKRDTLRVSTWPGGSTIELFIYPDDADLAKRNFELRISSATVEAEESTFSPFEGYVRHIAPLTGEMRLVHEGHHEAVLAPLQIDTFEGGWTTRSYGTCTDFNLIHKPGWKGEIFSAPASAILPCAPHGFTCLYAQSATKIETANESGERFEVRLGHGDVLVIETGPEERARVCVQECLVPPVVAAASRVK